MGSVENDQHQKMINMVNSENDHHIKIVEIILRKMINISKSSQLLSANQLKLVIIFETI